MLARATCASRRPLWSPTLILVHALIMRLIGSGLEPPCDDLAHAGRLPCDAAVWQDRVASAALRTGAQASAPLCFCADSGHTGLRLCVKKVKTGRPFYLYVSLF